MAGTESSRLRATRTLAALLQQRGSLASLLGPEDDALARELCFGCCRWYPQLTACLQQLLQKPLKAKDADVQALLLIGLYQLMHLRVPAHAAVNETVAACSGLKKPWARQLINGVLRNFQRREQEILAAIADNAPAQWLHPQWLIDAIRRDWPQHWQQILRANNCHAAMTLRVNVRRGDRLQYLQQLAAADMPASAGQWSETAIHLHQACAVLDLPGFAEGDISVQDEASQLVPLMLHAKDGMRVLDACAAPGGKTAQLLEQYPNLQVLALDSDARRLQRVADNLRRLQLEATLRCADASDTPAWWDGQAFDRILLDAPCSATGIIRRQPDIKLLRQATDVTRMAQLQTQLLASLWPCLASGGILLYTTCSVLQQENSAQIRAFLQTHNDASIDEPVLHWGVPAAPGRQLLPSDDAHSTDGFYFAALRKG